MDDLQDEASTHPNNKQSLTHIQMNPNTTGDRTTAQKTI